MKRSLLVIVVLAGALAAFPPVRQSPMQEYYAEQDRQKARAVDQMRSALATCEQRHKDQNPTRIMDCISGELR